jgi:hypothetical protein
MNTIHALEGIDRNVGDVLNNTDLVMAANTQELNNTTTINMSYVLTVMTLQKKVD